MVDLDLGIVSFLVASDGTVQELDPARNYIIGRGEETDIRINDTVASRQHCRLSWDQSASWQVEDLDSRNGTFLNGNRIEGSNFIDDGGQLQIGSFCFSLALRPAGTDPSSVQTSLPQAWNMETMEVDVGEDSTRNSAGTMAGTIPSGGLRELLRFFVMMKRSGTLMIDDDPSRIVRFVSGIPRDAMNHDQIGMNALKTLLDATGEFTFVDSDESIAEWAITNSSQEIIADLFSEEREQMRQAEEQALDIQRASRLQQHLMDRLPQVEGYNFGIISQGATGVSGDFYDIAKLDDGRIMMVLGDVSGHGFQAAMAATQTLKTLRLLRRQYSDLTMLLCRLNEEILNDLLPAQFITLFAAELQPETGCMTIALAGHHPAWCFSAGAEASPIGEPAPALGILDEEKFANSLKLQDIILQPGQGLVQVTDGVLEAADQNGELFDRHRLTHCLRSWNGSESMKDLACRITESVDDFAHRIDDDLTIIAVARTPSIPALDESHAPPEGADTESGKYGTAPHVAASTSLTAASQAANAMVGKHFGQARVLRPLAIDDHYVTLLAEHTALQMPVTVKFLRRDRLHLHTGINDLFMREVRQALRVQHPNVLRYMDAGQNENGEPFVLAEYIKGKTLAERLENEGPLPISDIIRFTAAIADGLAAIHACKLLHAGLEPGTIIVNRQGRPLICDQGLAVIVRQNNDDLTAAEQGRLAPEIRSGEHAPSVASDVYALGALTLEILTGTTVPLEPLNRTPVALQDLMKVHRPDAPDYLIELVRDCLHDDVNIRPKSSTISTRCRENNHMGQSTSTMAPPFEEASGNTSDANKRWLVIGGVLVLGLIGILVWQIMNHVGAS